MIMCVQWIRKGGHIGVCGGGGGGGGGAELDWLATCNMNIVKSCHISTSELFN